MQSKAIPFFSVCIPAYNAGRYLKQTIDSVLAQSFTDFEVIILDNASTDDTGEVLSHYLDDRIRILRNTATIPAHENWTRVVTMAQGRWTKLLCADDLLKPEALMQIAKDVHSHPNLMVHAGVRDVIDEVGRLVKAPRRISRDSPTLGLADLIGETLRLGTNPLGEPLCLTWRTSLTENVGPFSGYWKYFIDLDYWLRLASVTPIYCTSEVIGSFRVSKESWTSSIGFAALRESREFFLMREDMKSQSLLRRCKALLRALIRTVSRKLFLSFVLRQSHVKEGPL